ncbi:unnamed protein product [Polarella glacialis]|uniref:Uncharacterized protein n=1 Tax=Polarella glacialis TaxID=89957 RepID=A0A813F9C7_POLGL|nr:unnamed protein product [Polarella glacialis]
MTPEARAPRVWAPGAKAPKAKAKSEVVGDDRKVVGDDVILHLKPLRESAQEEQEEEKKVLTPDREAFDAQIVKIQEGIDKLQQKQASFAAKITQRSGGKEEFFAKRTELRAQLDELSSRTNELQDVAYRDAKKKIHEKMTELVESRKEKLGDLPKIVSQREEVGNEIREKIKERDAVRDEFRQAERDFSVYLVEQRKKRQEKIAEEKIAEKIAEDLRRKQREAGKLDEQPFVSEMTLIEQSILFCRTLVALKSAAKKEEKKDIAHNNKEGEEVLLRKEDREEEFFFAPTKGKKAKAAVTWLQLVLGFMLCLFLLLLFGSVLFILFLV